MVNGYDIKTQLIMKLIIVLAKPALNDFDSNITGENFSSIYFLIPNLNLSNIHFNFYSNPSCIINENARI